MAEPQYFYGHGKLLISGEYFVLDGAKALAVPTQLGQSLEVTTLENEEGVIYWQSIDDKGGVWLEASFNLNDFSPRKESRSKEVEALQGILKAARKLNTSFLYDSHSIEVKTTLEFNRHWGLGSSSTLLANIAQWAGINAFGLSNATFGGSGYDIACAQADSPIVYSLEEGQPHWKSISAWPAFADNLYFIYLGKKQNSREAIQYYREHKQQFDSAIKEISEITDKIVLAHTLPEFEQLLQKHERIISTALKMEKTKDIYFKDYWGAVKSLGAWGGDFVLATSNRSPEATRDYFNQKGFDIFFPYKGLIFAS